MWRALPTPCESLETSRPVTEEVLWDRNPASMETRNYKGLLNSFCSKNNKSTPTFNLECIGPPHDPSFICKVRIDDKIFGEAEGKQKKEAENKASKITLQALGYQQIGIQPDFVAVLNEFCQKKGWTWNIVEENCSGPPHNPEFTCRSKVNDRQFPECSKKKNKKLARKEAAFLALKELKKEFTNDIQELPEVFLDDSRSENWSYSGSNGDLSLDKSENEMAHSAGKNGLDQSAMDASEHQANFIAVLNDFCQKKRIICNYLDTNLDGPPHNRQYSCRAEINDKTFPESKPHKTKNLARKEAAFLAYIELVKDFPEIASGFTAGPLNATSSAQRTPIENGVHNVSLADAEVSSQTSTSSDNPFKDFEDITKIASGSFGQVFKAKKILDERYYAVKRVPVRHKGTRNVEEVRALARLDHPHIVRYFNAWWADNYDYISDCSETSSSSSDLKQNSQTCLFIQMELCEKGSLKEWIKERNSSPNSVNKYQCLQFFRQIVEAIKYIHSQKLIHRDLKPANILFTKEMVVKLGDFGLVTQMTGDDESKARQRTQGTGTLCYMAPEQRDGNRYENEVDIYALGLILVELLWKIKFNSTHEKSIHWSKIRKCELPVDFVSQYPFEVCEIKRMLYEDPKKRPSAEYLLKNIDPNTHLNTRTQ